MINKWYEVGKYCQYLSVLSPSCLGNVNNATLCEEDLVRIEKLHLEDQLHKPCQEIRTPLLKLLVTLENNVDILQNDYKQFVHPLFTSKTTGDDTPYFLDVCVSFEFFKTYCTVTRLTEALREYMETDDLENDEDASIRFFIRTLLPSRSLYHNTKNEPVTADGVLNSLFEKGFFEHINNLAYPYKCEIEDDKYVFGNDCSSESGLAEIHIVTQDPPLNNLLKWFAELFSYPVLPPNIISQLVSTADKREGKIDVLEPGFDSKLHQRSVLDPVICFNCKLFNLSLGQTDDTEQRDYLECTCLYKGKSDSDADTGNVSDERMSDLDKLSTVSARTILNLIQLFHEKKISETHSCECEDHSKLFQKYIENMFKLLTRLQVVNKV